GNVVDEGDYNTQTIDQANTYTNPTTYGSYSGPVQTNFGLNVVEYGDNNEQTITQTNTLTVTPTP
ncbi:MAG: hypothetical protein JWQ89_4441, partial [Devosia sp.]|uniref:hypothetical protein n=1 Tax=Devosia sp. TaxID=1871048 RepID=UPI002610E52B